MRATVLVRLLTVFVIGFASCCLNWLQMQMVNASASIISNTQAQQWTSLEGPNGAKVSAFLTHKQYLFAGTAKGAYRSEDNGQSWKLMTNSLSSQEVRSFAVGGATLFAGTSTGVFRSPVDGQSWVAANQGIESLTFGVDKLAASSQVVIVSGGSGAFRSTDTGQNWTAIEAFRNEPITAIQVNEGIIFIAVDRKGIRKSLRCN